MSDRPFNNPFGGLAGRKGDLPAQPASAAPRPAATPSAPPRSLPRRAVVRIERKGRGGKVVTLVEQLGLAGAELEAWASELKRGLGCGGTVEGDAIALQGDQRETARRWLERRGVEKVSVG